MNIKTKFDIGDTFWGMLNNIPTQYTVSKIYVTCDVKRIKIEYQLTFKSIWGGNFVTYSEETLSTNLGRSKKELLCKVFGDCIEDGKVLK